MQTGAAMLPEKLSTKIPRLIMALIFISGSIDGFYYVFMGTELIHFPETEQAHKFTEALRTSGFFWPFMKSIQLIGGLSLLFRLYAPFGFALLIPVITTIVLFHFIINWPGAIFGVVLVVFSAWLLFEYRTIYGDFLKRAQAA
jgi:putative oxidoreductase